MALASSDRPVPPDSEPVSAAAYAALASACLGWMFDSMDINLFTLVLYPSVSELIGSTKAADVSAIGGPIIATKLFAWGLGGIGFGLVADRIGRTRTMIITVLIYSAFTALSGLARTWQEMAICQALAGVGIGGEWAAGAALVAETWPARLRVRAMLIMQMSFAFGNFAAGVVSFFIAPHGWRWVMAFGAAPALLTLFIRGNVQEPERWRRTRDRLRAAGEPTFEPFRAIFRPGLRRNTIVGVIVTAASLIAGFTGTAMIPIFANGLLGASPVPGANARLVSQAFMVMNIGAVFGYVSVIWLADLLGRRLCYSLFAVLGLGAIVMLFTLVSTPGELVFGAFFYGALVLGGVGNFAVYLPELFPTRYRATGQGFCWNAGRLLTGFGPLVAGQLVRSFGSVSHATLAVAWVFLIGLVAIWFGPETRGRSLED